MFSKTKAIRMHMITDVGLLALLFEVVYILANFHLAVAAEIVLVIISHALINKI